MGSDVSFRGFFAAIIAAVMLAALPASAQAAVSSTPSATSPGFDNTVWAVAHWGNTVYVGGEFNQVTDWHGATFVRHGAAAFDAVSGEVLPWDPNVDGPVYALRPTSKGVYVGGGFGTVRGQTRHNLARVSLKGAGTLSASFKRGTNGRVRTIDLGHGRIYLGGNFSKAVGKKRWNTAALSSTAPYKLTSWAPKTVNGGVDEVHSTKRGIYIAGRFRKVGNNSQRHRLTLVTKDKGKLVTGFKPFDLNYEVFDIVVRDNRIYAAEAGPGGHVFAMNATTGHTVWSHWTDGDSQAVELVGNTLYLGGHFNRVCDDPSSGRTGTCRHGTWLDRKRAAAIGINHGHMKAWNPSGNSVWGVRALDYLPKSGSLAAGGHVTAWGGSTAPARLAIFGSDS